MNMEVRHDIAEQQIVDMTRLEYVFDSPSDILNVRPVMGELVWCKIGEGRDMSAPKHHCHMAGSYSLPFNKSLADSAAVEGLAGQIGTKRTSDTLLARFPVLRPGSFHVIARTLWSVPTGFKPFTARGTVVESQRNPAQIGLQGPVTCGAKHVEYWTAKA